MPALPAAGKPTEHYLVFAVHCAGAGYEDVLPLNYFLAFNLSDLFQHVNADY